MRPTLLHVTNGESAGNTLWQTTLGGAVRPWQDVLHGGPVPAVERRELLRVRARSLSDCGWGGRQALLSSLERRGRQFVAALHDGSHVVLWFEHDLYDQLQLVDALVLAAGRRFARPIRPRADAAAQRRRVSHSSVQRSVGFSRNSRRRATASLRPSGIRSRPLHACSRASSIVSS